jgi:hypothetical protein
LKTLQAEIATLAAKENFDCYDAERIEKTAGMYTEYACVAGIQGDWRSGKYKVHPDYKTQEQEIAETVVGKCVKKSPPCDRTSGRQKLTMRFITTVTSNPDGSVMSEIKDCYTGIRTQRVLVPPSKRAE